MVQFSRMELLPVYRAQGLKVKYMAFVECLWALLYTLGKTLICKCLKYPSMILFAITPDP